jgi:N-dimethylarginine dimethylaminohydrolase
MHRQHDTYIKTLKGIGLKISEFSYSDNPLSHPFIEHSMVMANNTALLSDKLLIMPNDYQQSNYQQTDHQQPKHQRELYYLRNFLNDQSIPNMVLNKNSHLNGGDIIHTKNCIFVGISDYTNQTTYKRIQMIYESSTKKKVYPIHVPKNLLLKQCLTLLDEDEMIDDCCTFVVNKHGESALRQISFDLNGCSAIRLPDLIAANILRINRTILIPAGYPDSYQIIKQATKFQNVQCQTIDISEFTKANGNLTSLSVLLH